MDTYFTLICGSFHEVPFGYLENVPIKTGDFYVVDDFVVLDMVVNAYTQIILGQPFLSTSGCKIDVREGCLTFYVGGIMLNLSCLKTRISPLLHLL